MRKSPYLNQVPIQLELQAPKNRDSQDFLYQPIYKQDVNKLYSNIAAYLPNSSKSNTQYLLYQRNNKIGAKRPLTVNRTHSELKNKSIRIFIQVRKKNLFCKTTSNCGYPLSGTIGKLLVLERMIRQKAESIEEVVGNLMIAPKFKGRNIEKLVDIVMPQE